MPPSAFKVLPSGDAIACMDCPLVGTIYRLRFLCKVSRRVSKRACSRAFMTNLLWLSFGVEGARPPDERGIHGDAPFCSETNLVNGATVAGNFGACHEKIVRCHAALSKSLSESSVCRHRTRASRSGTGSPVSAP